MAKFQIIPEEWKEPKKDILVPWEAPEEKKEEEIPTTAGGMPLLFGGAAQAAEITPLPPEVAPISADLLAKGGELVIPEVPVSEAPDKITDLTADLEGYLKLLQTQMEEAKKAKEITVTEQEEAKTKIQKWWETLTGREAKLEAERERWEVPETLEQIKTLVAEAGTIRDNIINLGEQRDARKLALEERGGVPLDLLTRRQAIVDRQYNSRIAAESARLGAKASMIQALQGNLATARELANETVNAMVYDQQIEYQMLTATYNMNKDLIDDLSEEYQTIFTNLIAEKKDQLALARQDQEAIMNLTLSAATDYGITLDLTGYTKEEAINAYKAAVTPAAKRKFEAGIAGAGGVAVTPTDIAAWVQAVNQDPSVLSLVPSEIRTQVITGLMSPREWSDTELKAKIEQMQMEDLGYQQTLDNIALSTTILNKDRAMEIAGEIYGIKEKAPTAYAWEEGALYRTPEEAAAEKAKTTKMPTLFEGALPEYTVPLFE